ncbi:TIGR03749 family integrating conjugative element protein [Uliginosibacterium gangwonense]|uniref:TIGR03749 family integrating conjugative element protein n=1 Tax=Uliginosibacterium gangwonense TaxID=392736 RepID=UPI00037A0A0D|nr:TIGR03749 family integrating conjugative element protein [Uliginosibacterium gangwonense]
MNARPITFGVVALLFASTCPAQSFEPLDDSAAGNATTTAPTVAPPAPAPGQTATPVTPPSTSGATKAPRPPVASNVQQPGQTPGKAMASAGNKKPATQLPLDLEPNGKTERVLFDRRPIRVAVATGRERIVHLPWVAAIEIPSSADPHLQIQVIDKQAFIRSDVATQVRVVAQGMEGEGFIPLDITVREGANVPDELDVFVKAEPTSTTLGKAQSDDDDAESIEAPDMVQMSRYCLQQVYAPQRLIKPLPGVRQVEIKSAPVAGLYRGGAVMSTPIGAWRSTDQYVTAVRLTNRLAQPLDLDMEALRGHWLAATPQHWRLLPNGSDADTTVVCLISAQAFDASR